ncbi:unnamed protein product, partial [Staurois parvus]
MLLVLVISGKNVPCIGGQQEEGSLHWSSIGRMLLTLVISGENAPYIDAQWEEGSLHWWLVRRMLFTLVVIGKNVSFHSWSVGRMSPYTNGQCEECLLILVVTRKKTPYIGGQQEEGSLHG